MESKKRWLMRVQTAKSLVDLRPTFTFSQHLKTGKKRGGISRRRRTEASEVGGKLKGSDKEARALRCVQGED